MDIVEIAEKVFECSLTDYQKEFLRKVYETVKDNKELIYTIPRGGQRFYFTTLYALAVIVAAQERGLLKVGNKHKEQVEV